MSKDSEPYFRWRVIAGLWICLVIGACDPFSKAPATITQDGVIPSPGSDREMQISATPTRTGETSRQQAGDDTQLTEGPFLLGMSDLATTGYIPQKLPSKGNAYFSTSGKCVLCHTEMEDQAGSDVSTDRLWRASMMANASRDPYWQASVKSQMVNVPELSGEIEDKCATCHMPLARFTAASSGKTARIFGDGLNDPQHPEHGFAMEGVSCTLCHQVGDENLGLRDSFSGNFVIDAERPPGSRWAYGPYPAGDRQELIMGKPSDFLPVDGVHVHRSALCATCHTLYTPYLDRDGEIGGLFPEQVPFLEWQQSNYVKDTSCQDCHMPTAQGGVVLSTTGGEPRSPFYQHQFVGGNTYVLRILRAFGDELDVAASAVDVKHKIEDTLFQLQHDTARLDINKAELKDSELRITLVLKNFTGHKFPTAFPARRAWIRLTVANQEGEVIYESGGYEDTGLINGGNHDLDPGAYEPHYDLIQQEEDVQIYESVLEDVEGEITTTLLHASGYTKDNRLLPSGFEKSSAMDDTRVIGEAARDDNFQGGRDRITYLVPTDGHQGPYRVTAELLYQSIAYRWAINLAEDNSPQGDRFLTYYDQTPNWPVLISRDELQVTRK